MSVNKLIIALVIVVLICAALISGVLALNIFYPKKISAPLSNQTEKTNIIKKIDFVAPEFTRPQAEVSIIAVGDIMLSRSVEQLMVRRNDFELPFRLLASFTDDADITLGNLETAIISGRPILTGEFSFRTNPKSVGGLKLAGFDLVSLANNHTPNFGQDGLKNTFKELDSAGIKYVGAGLDNEKAKKSVIIEKQGIKFGFLAYVYPDLPAGYKAGENRAGLNFMDLDQLKSDIANLKPQVDFVIVQMHAGTEYIFTPNKQQTEFARLAIDSGACIVIGHHPHVVQTFEKYKNGYIIYSLGNYIFDQMWSVETQQGLLAKIIFSPNEIKEIDFFPLRINSSFQPEFASEKESQEIIKRLSLLLDSGVRFFWQDEDYKKENYGFSLSNNQKQVNKIYQYADLDSDGNLEEAVVVEGVGYLIKDNKVFWQTEPKWQVDNVLIGDFNNDKKPEVGFSLWKEGSYGPNLPFWEKENDNEIKNHLFLYQWQADAFKMVWGSSTLDQPILEMALVDLDKDGKNELAVLEGNYDIKAEENNLSIWQFDDFNFVNIYKSEKSNFFGLQINLENVILKIRN